MTGFAQHT